MAEQFVIAHCLKNGWSVSKTVGDNQLYDLILDKKDNSLYKVQVKHSLLKRGAVYCDVRSTGYTFNGEGKRKLFSKKYSPQDIDFIAIYCSDNNCCYLVKNEGKSAITLRIDPAKNNNKKNVILAKDYQI